jgi:pimeloyl-ACP methyl ester carboxylesterase
MVLVHGLEDAWENWGPFAAQLDERWRACALDMPWRAGNDYSWRLEGTPADHLEAGLRGLSGGIDLLVGHSFGANALLELLASRANPPSAPVVLLTPFFRPPDVELTWELMARSWHQYTVQIREGVLAKLGPRGARLDGELVDRMATMTLQRIGTDGFMTVFSQFALSGSLPLASVANPVLILAGAADTSLGRRQATKLAGSMVRATLVVEDDYDHFCHTRRPSDVVAHMMRFMEREGAASRIVAAEREGEQ